MKFSVLYTAAAAGAITLLSVGGCGASRTWPGPPGTMIRAACTYPVTPLSAAQLERAYQAPAMSADGVTRAGTRIMVTIPAAALHNVRLCGAHPVQATARGTGYLRTARVTSYPARP